MLTTPLTALCPLDGRYQAKLASLRPLCSEYALIRYRAQVEVAWLEALVACPTISASLANDQSSLDLLIEDMNKLRARVNLFSEADAEEVKKIEMTINHDVKALEYWLKKTFASSSVTPAASEFIHFACTSEDINNLSYALMLKDVRKDVLFPALESLISQLLALSKQTAALPMLSRTHGQAATPTTVGKEFANVVHRLKRQCQTLLEVPIMGKLNGAVGNFNAHVVAYPDVDWPDLARRVVEGLGLEYQALTTQIEPHDYMAEWFHALVRINTVLIDLNRDLWGYIAWGYFKQKSLPEQVGSSTMPHKVNPIDFENAEGNLGLANALLSHFAEKLPISRWQRDLSDSTVLRNIGVALGYSLLGFDACLRGLNKLECNPTRLAEDLNLNWEVLAEPIQTVMRRYGLPEPYEQLKALTRGKQGINPATLHTFINALELPAEVKQTLLALTPATYTGLAEDLAQVD